MRIYFSHFKFKKMATLQLHHSLINANPGLLDKIKAYFDSMFIFDEQDDYTIYQVEKHEQIGDIQIVLDFQVCYSEVVISGHHPA